MLTEQRFQSRLRLSSKSTAGSFFTRRTMAGNPGLPYASKLSLRSAQRLAEERISSNVFRPHPATCRIDKFMDETTLPVAIRRATSGRTRTGKAGGRA